MKEIAKAKGIAHYFEEIYGSPKNKIDWGKHILDTYNIKAEETLFIGDAMNDYIAAEENGMHFLLRKTTENLDIPSSIPKIENLLDLNKVLMENIYMEQKALVSIIIPCYNQAIYLKESAESAIRQSYKNIEIIIVNDGSQDNTQEILENLRKKYPERIKVISQKNSGLSLARNAGIEKAKGRYIVPLDADDLLSEKMIEMSMNTMVEYNADIVYSGYRLFGTVNRKNYLKPFYKNIILYWNVCSATALYKKEVWKTIGGYKENMHGGYEDWEFWINAYKHNFKFQHINEILWSYRRKETSMVEDAKKKDNYLRAKIIMNHPELYTIDYTKNAIATIRTTEAMADLYFYYLPNITLDIKKIQNELGLYLATNNIKQKQTLHIGEKRIGLIDLELFENMETVWTIQKELTTNIILFYSNLRYNLREMKEYSQSWCKTKGFIPTKGTIFPYTYKELRTNENMQFTAQKRLFCYQQVLLAIEKNKKIEQLEKSLKIQYNTLNSLLNDICTITTYSIIKHPYKKFKAYKAMLQTYYKVRKRKK
jgi:glycosyltransferase involved in cell wall biosynthesis